ncbi:MAG: metalloregulator ArsR/SmtB family transcription factor [Xanthomonadales bacterium]|nr:metalloregulator ArsR/SmtB family transcription factor [Xanthomonadales bacterium]
MQSNPQLDQVFFALSDATRRSILARLSESSATIGELAEPFAISKPAITKHMKILERAGLIDRRIAGRQHTCTLSTAGLRTAEDWINFHRRFWESRFDALENLLRDQELEQE